MRLLPSKGMLLASCLALLMHLLLFVASSKTEVSDMTTISMSPKTDYAVQTGVEGVDVNTVRAIKSPVLFSLPSSMGFSSELQNHDVQNQKAFSPLQVRAEQFLQISSAKDRADRQLRPEQLMISAGIKSPVLPVEFAVPDKSTAQPKRVFLAPEISGRLEGGIVLPPILNKPVEKTWMVLASVSISEQGVVEHVFLDQPLESKALNQQVLQVLYNLRFKPGPATESRIEIYSPESSGISGGAE